MAKGLKPLKVIVGLDGAKPLLSTTVVGSADLLALATGATASLLVGADGLPSLLVVQITSVPVTPDLPLPDPIPMFTPGIELTTEDGRILTTEDGRPLILPDDLNAP